MPINLLFYLFILVAIAFIGGVACKLVKLPPHVGYLLSGLLLSAFLGRMVEQETIVFLSEIGAVLLLFTLGVEFSFSRLKEVAKTAIYGGIIQIVVTGIVLAPLLLFFNLSLFESFFASLAFSLSSTAVVVKLLADKGELESIPGEILVGWLILQDLAVFPLTVVLLGIGQSASSGVSIATLVSVGNSILVAGAALVLTLFLGKQIVPWLMGKIASLNNRELLVVGIFTVAVGGALGAQFLGFSAALGAFLAGLLISQTLVNHAVFSEVRPLRDIFALLFFTTLGLVLPPGFFVSHIGPIILLTLLVIFVKFIIVFVLSICFDHHTKTSFIVALGLTEVGEFAFILGSVGKKSGIIGSQAYGYIVSVALLSIVLLPPLFLSSGRLYIFLHTLVRKYLTFLHVNVPRVEIMATELSYTNHVVLCGYGRVGKYVGRAFDMANISYVVVEYNYHKARELKAKGIPVVYGDPADINILDYAQVDKARAVIIAIPDLHTQKEVITNSLTLNKKIEIYCRTHHEDELKILKALGVAAVIQPEFEASLSITNKILKAFGQKAEDIEGKISRLKIEHGLG